MPHSLPWQGTWACLTPLSRHPHSAATLSRGPGRPNKGPTGDYGNAHLQIVTFFHIEVEPVFELLEVRGILQELFSLSKGFQTVGFPETDQQGDSEGPLLEPEYGWYVPLGARHFRRLAGEKGCVACREK